MTNAELISLWIAGTRDKSPQSRALWFETSSLYSYTTKVLTIDRRARTFVEHEGRRSATTNRQINLARKLLRDAGFTEVLPCP